MPSFPLFRTNQHAHSAVTRFRWTKPFAMVAAAAVALTGVTVLQSIGSGKGAWAEGPQVDPERSQVTFDPAPDPNSPRPTGDQGGYAFTLVAVGPDGFVAWGAALRLRIESLDGSEGAIELSTGEEPAGEVVCFTDGEGKCAGWVRADHPGEYQFSAASDESPDELFAVQPLYFAQTHPEPGRSLATITNDAKQPANRGDPGLTEADWGRQVITVKLIEEGGAALTGQADKLAVRVREDDPFRGDGLYLTEWEESKDNPGQYSLTVQSAKAGGRRLEVVWADAESQLEFTLFSNQETGETALVAAFVYPPVSPDSSYLEVTTTDAQGQPLNLRVGESYQAKVVVWDSAMSNLIPNQTVALAATGACRLNAGLTSANLRSDGDGEVAFTVLGVDAGACSLSALIDDQDVYGSPNPNLTWRAVGDVGTASAAKSFVAIRALGPDPYADHDAPGLDPATWGAHVLTVTLLDDADQPVADGAAGLSAVADPSDPLGGARLYFGNGGVFQCVDALVDGACAGGVYELEVYAGTGGQRRLTVGYAAGAEGPFQLKDQEFGLYTVVNAYFQPLAADRDWSTVMVSPSSPAEDPDNRFDQPNGVPTALRAGESYEVTATMWDSGRVNRVRDWNTIFRLELEGSGCEAEFPGQSRYLEGYAIYGDGRVQVEVTSQVATTCQLVSASGELPGLPKTLTWTDPPLDTTSPATYYTVSSGALVANYDEGFIEVQLHDADGRALTAAEDSIKATAPAGSGIEIDSFGAYDEEGAYLAFFTGAKAGDFEITVTVGGQALSLLRPGGNATAHFVDESSYQQPAEWIAYVSQESDQPANHDAPGSLRPDWGFQEIRVDLRDAEGVPVTDAAASLTAQAAASDPFGGAGLYFAEQGRFGCEEDEVDGACLSGLYGLDVFSSKAGTRQLVVTYKTPAGAVVTLSNNEQYGGSPVLRAPFSYPPVSAADSTMVIRPSTPQDDPDDPSDEPDGVPDPLPADGSAVYDVIITTWDAGRNNRVPDVYVDLMAWSKSDPADGYSPCEGLFVGTPENIHYIGATRTDQNGRGHATVMVAPQNIFASVQECQLRARVEVEESYGGMAD
ncbi:MAG: Ig-like domain-containing protein, partial [Bifidobacteriaceae bacterium]|nr:Ig-like domain-containing protein [Bifidobacteriaceae bacterium]